MADKDQPDDAPQLEMPSLSLRRKKRDAPDNDAEPQPQSQPETRPKPEPEPKAEPEAEAEPEPEPEPQPEPTPEPAAQERARRQVTLPDLSGLTAALVTGAVVGGLAVLVVWLATAACDAIRGTPSCGGGPGLLVLVATLVLLAYLGGWLLRGFGVPEPGSTSFLGAGLMAVVAVLFFADVLADWWMVIVVPVLAMAGYALSWWVTTKVVTDAEEPRPHDVPHDVP